VTLAAGPPELPGALATRDYLHKCVVTAKVVRDASQAAAVPLECRLLQDQAAVWMLRGPENSDDVWLGPAGYLEIRIGKIRTEHRNGPSNVHVRWTNLSHPDGDKGGELVATVQKSPLVVVGHKVGIGSIPTPDGPDFDNETLRAALACAKAATQAVVSSSIRGHVKLDCWSFNDLFGHFQWPTISWAALDVYWPRGNRRMGIPRVDPTPKAWRELFAWFKDYPNPGFPRYPRDVPYFRRSPYELFFLYDPAQAYYLDGPSDNQHQGIQSAYAAAKAVCRSEIGLPLKPNCSLYARIDLEGTADASQPWIRFENFTLPEETRPHDWVFIARWDENGVTAGCDFKLGDSLGVSDLRAVRLPSPPAP
jgi:hypothetical protein